MLYWDAIATLFDVLEAEIYALKWTCTSSKDNTANIYTDSRNAFREAHDFGMLW